MQGAAARKAADVRGYLLPVTEVCTVFAARAFQNGMTWGISAPRSFSLLDNQLLPSKEARRRKDG